MNYCIRVIYSTFFIQNADLSPYHPINACPISAVHASPFMQNPEARVGLLILKKDMKEGLLV